MNLSAQITEKINKEAAVQAAKSLELCYDLHSHPEISYQEVATAEKMARELANAGFEVTKNFSGNSVVGLLKNGPGPVIMLRTDMDALPVEEKTGFPFASKQRTRDAAGNEVPVMHACGHDIHMSVWAGTIRTLAALKKEWSGTLLVIAQQAEEVSGGAGKAIEAGLFAKFPLPDYALAFHINPELESGTIGLTGGPVFAGVKTVGILVHGRGGHGAYPEKCIDPIVIASRIVLDLQTIVSRETNPFDPVVVTVGTIHGGTKANVIPDEVKLDLSVRYYSQEAITCTLAAIQRISNGAAMTAGMPAEKFPQVTVVTTDTPPVMNNEKLSEKVLGFASQTIGAAHIVKVKPAMVAEDFGKYGLTSEKVPICLIWLGSTGSDYMKELAAKGERPAPLHSSLLHPDYPTTIETGIRVMTANVMGLCRK